MKSTPLVLASFTLTTLSVLPMSLAQVAAPAPSAPAPAPRAPGIINPLFSASRPKAEYPVPYGVPSAEEITKVLVRIHDYLAANTPAKFVSRATGEDLPPLTGPNPDAQLARGAFNVIGYEWGVVYSGMLAAAESTGDPRFRDYVGTRMKFIADTAPVLRGQAGSPITSPQALGPGRGGFANLFRAVNNPHTLDDAGSMCAAMIKTSRAGLPGDYRPLIDNWIAWIHTKQERLDDGTLSRSRPLPKSLWLDDLYMSVPALAQMGSLTGEQKYFDDAVKQITQFSQRMFVREKGLWMHGWVQEMDVHPAFHWARANGWALLAMTELLDVLPEKHTGRAFVLDLYRTQVQALAKLQTKDGRWTQLLDRPDSYLETSATAIYAYCIARGINNGWLNAQAFGPMATLAWHAVTTQVNDKGQIENVCVGTGMGFEPAFYYARPVSNTAPHGPGPVLLAGAEMVKLAKNQKIIINDEALMFGHPTGM